MSKARILFVVSRERLVARLVEIDRQFFRWKRGLEPVARPAVVDFLSAEQNWLHVALETFPLFPSIRRDFCVSRKHGWRKQLVARSYLKHSSHPSPPPCKTPLSLGWVYFVRVGDCIKIGFALDVTKRIATLQTGSPTPLELLAKVRGSYDDERRFHKRFSSLRKRGEWFEARDPLTSFVRSLSEAA